MDFNTVANVAHAATRLHRSLEEEVQEMVDSVHRSHESACSINAQVADLCSRITSAEDIFSDAAQHKRMRELSASEGNGINWAVLRANVEDMYDDLSELDEGESIREMWLRAGTLVRCGLRFRPSSATSIGARPGKKKTRRPRAGSVRDGLNVQ